MNSLRIFASMMAALPLLAPPAMAASKHMAKPIGSETVISMAGNGGLRGWQAGTPGSGTLYVRDRRERWYQITLTGPCVTDPALDTLNYTTDNNGTFDLFSKVSVARYPSRQCGVTSIRTSLPPAGQPGAPPTAPSPAQ